MGGFSLEGWVWGLVFGTQLSGAQHSPAQRSLEPKTELGWAGLDWTGLGWAGLDWAAALGCAELGTKNQASEPTLPDEERQRHAGPKRPKRAKNGAFQAPRMAPLNPVRKSLWQSFGQGLGPAELGYAGLGGLG